MSSKSITVEKIVRDYLIQNGFEGLCNDDYCGCGIDDFMPCISDGVTDCEPAYFHEPTEDYPEGYWSEEKPEAKNV